MFGYIIVNKPEMKIKDFETYRSYYCGLCRKLKERHGLVGQSTLSYDMTFLHLLLTSLYELEVEIRQEKCLVHPFTKHKVSISEITEYVADMNVILSYYKCKDDWNDEKKYLKLASLVLLKSGYQKVQHTYGEKIEKIHKYLNEISKMENENQENLDLIAGCFGNVMAEIFTYGEDEWSKGLHQVGYYLGKFVYLLDAYEDLEDDIKKGTYNPYKNMYQQEGFEEHCDQILTMMITECAREFEKMPILQNVEILRNIIYSGIWSRYEIVRKKRDR